VDPDIPPEPRGDLVASFRSLRAPLFGKMVSFHPVRLRVGVKFFGCFENISPDRI
jgi:hypothetical protein